jgi:hypothetical protein
MYDAMGNISINLLFTGMTGTCEPLVMQFEFQSYMRTFIFSRIYMDSTRAICFYRRTKRTRRKGESRGGGKDKIKIK